MFILRCFLIFVLFCAFDGVKANAPLLLWDENDGHGIAPRTIEALEELLAKSPEESRSMLVVFEERKLRQEDLTLCQLEKGEKCFKFLEGKKPAYFPDAPSPLDLTDRDGATLLLKNDGTVWPNILNETKLSRQMVVVNFESPDAEISRAEVLAQHDKLMEKFYKDLAVEAKVFGVYTAVNNAAESTETCPRQRVRREAGEEEKPEPKKEFNIQNKFFMVYDDLSLIEITEVDNKPKLTKTKIELSNPDLKRYDYENEDYFTYNISFSSPGGSLKFAVKITNETGYWEFIDLAYNDVPQFINETFVIPLTFSFACCNATFGYKNKYLRWEGLQFQPNLDEKLTNKIVFGDPWHCFGFTTPAIWGGIFVSVLLLIILSVGICCMLDLKTNDRFDDPKGKTITVTATE